MIPNHIKECWKLCSAVCVIGWPSVIWEGGPSRSREALPWAAHGPTLQVPLWTRAVRLACLFQLCLG